MIPIETRARAALRLTADLHAKAIAGPSANPDHEARRVAFLQVYPAVVATAERRPFACDYDPDKRARVDPRQGLIEALLRIAGIKAEAFESECEAVDAGERAAIDAVTVFVESLRKPVRSPIVFVGGEEAHA
jgi:hypothetical protein